MEGVNPIRIIHFLAKLEPGGIETWLLYVLRNIDRTRFHLTFCTMWPSQGARGVYEPEVEALGARIVRCPWQRNLLRFGRDVRRVLDEGRYDVVHAHPQNLAGYITRVAHRADIPGRILHLHTIWDGKQPTLPRRAYRAVMARLARWHATHMLGCSRGSLDVFFGPHWRRDPRMRVLYYGVQTSLLDVPADNAGVRAEFGIPLDVPLLIHVGRLSYPKNHAGLIRICEALHRRRPEMHFLFVGDGELRAEIEAQVAATGIAHMFHLAGRRGDVARLLKAGDVFVMPSNYEGMPVALLEATAAGLPAVVADLPGCHEANEVATRAEILSIQRPPEEWAERVLDVLARPRPDPREALERIRRSPFDSNQSIAELCRVYDGCVGRR
ncbi:MAG: putative glycosyltransferase EpsF [Phycisphaerae bacterium]|nr:putative glycosyltransferase EpsF [Phycisphaerae bacterium]